METRRRGLILRGPVAIGVFCAILGLLMLLSGQSGVVVLGGALVLGGLAIALNLPKLQVDRAKQVEEEKGLLQNPDLWPQDDCGLGVFLILFAERYGLKETTAILGASRAKHRAMHALRLAIRAGLPQSLERGSGEKPLIAEQLLTQLDSAKKSALGVLVESLLAEREKLPEDKQDLFVPSTWSLREPDQWPPGSLAGAYVLRYAITNGVESTADAICRIQAPETAIRAIEAVALEDERWHLETKYGAVVEPLLGCLRKRGKRPM